MQCNRKSMQTKGINSHEELSEYFFQAPRNLSGSSVTILRIRFNTSAIFLWPPGGRKTVSKVAGMRVQLAKLLRLSCVLLDPAYSPSWWRQQFHKCKRGEREKR